MSVGPSLQLDSWNHGVGLASRSIRVQAAQENQLVLRATQFCGDHGGLCTDLAGLLPVLVWGRVDSEKWPDTNEGWLRHSKVFLFSEPWPEAFELVLPVAHDPACFFPPGHLYLLFREAGREGPRQAQDS